MVHADNSAGLESFAEDSPFNAVRVGLLQFGILPYENSVLSRVQPEPVFSFHTRVGLVKTVPAGTGISYGRTFTVTRDTRVAVLTAGYGDGIPRAASNRASVLIRGRRCPVLGRVTMDQTIVDVSAVDDVAAGDAVTLVGRQGDASIGIAEFSLWGDSIPWETLTSVTKRVPRVYRTSLGL
jgi:alanine racemase